MQFVSYLCYVVSYFWMVIMFMANMLIFSSCAAQMMSLMTFKKIRAVLRHSGHEDT